MTFFVNIVFGLPKLEVIFSSLFLNCLFVVPFCCASSLDFHLFVC